MKLLIPLILIVSDKERRQMGHNQKVSKHYV